MKYLSDVNRFVKVFVNYYAALRGARIEVAELTPVIEDYFMKKVDDTFSKQLGYNILTVLTSPVTGPLVEQGNPYKLK
ncbi:hypothetical protein QBC36DRAFT_293687 [Triangularia setosa]|uniref:Uncharacterized protein n=1 Tax=Triangularia setosa TaxID=2587417 RepID=A0AAN6W2N3_9PEZI|nr:hypothetical protein QBC36DRAFT_293687 [Podospora setosa]